MNVDPAIRVALLLAGLVVWACSDSASDAPTTQERSPDSVPAAGEASRVYERRVVFLSADPDSLLIVPWFFNARTELDGVVRELRGWLARQGEWEPFFREGWRGAPVRAPWRPLPRGPLRIVVGPGDALEEVVYEEGARRLEVRFGSLLVEWAGTEGQIYRIHEASALVSTGEVGGLLLDMSRSRSAGPVAGDWAFVMSGDTLQVVIDATERPTGAEQPAIVPGTGWARVAFRRLQWPDLILVPEEVRAFEPARRDVPVVWGILAADGSVEGRLRAVGNEIEAGAGSGARLPVYALFEVNGEITVEGRTYPVRGILRHRRP